MKAVIYNIEDGRVVKSFNTMRGAKGAFTRMCKLSDCENLELTTEERYLKTGFLTATAEVVVYSIFDQKRENPIKIRRCDVGGPCDPSMESYHSM